MQWSENVNIMVQNNKNDGEKKVTLQIEQLGNPQFSE